ncbi:MAG: helix-turn-helix domain-containing protein [Nanoarchaeota archaeon]
MDTSVLSELGFSDREIKVYIALLELGSSKAGPIAARSGLPHTKVYETLGKLIQKGLVSYIVVSKTKFFEPADPKEIQSIIAERSRRFEGLMVELEEKCKFAKDRQVAVVHEGYKAVKAIFARAEAELKRGDFYRVFALKETYREQPVSIGFLRSFHERLEVNGVADRLLGHLGSRREIRSMYFGNKNIKMRFVRRSMPVGVMIYGNKVIQIIWGERPTAIEIVSRQMFDQYVSFFDEMWESAR